MGYNANMILPQDVAALKDVAQQATSAYVLLGMSPSYDAVASALSIYLSLKAAGKEVQIACPDDMRVEFSHLVGVDEVKKTIGNRNLVVSFDYEENSVEKVSYNISEDGKKFNLTISPKVGGKPLDSNQIQYSYSGAEAELVFLVGVGTFEDLAELYQDNRALFDNATTVSLNAYQVQPFAKINLDASGQSCMAEGAADMLTELGFDPREDIATNLLSSIEQATQRFQSLGVNAETFEAAARLMRNGARRSSSNPALNPNVQTNTPAFAQVLKDRTRTGTISRRVTLSPQTSQPTMPKLPLRQQQQQAAQQAEQVANDVKATESTRINQLKRAINEPAQEEGSTDGAPNDWTQPKVFTGSTRV